MKHAIMLTQDAELRQVQHESHVSALAAKSSLILCACIMQ